MLLQIVADVIDACWLVPNHPSERKYFIANFQKHFILFLRTAQGSRMAGLTWATIVSLVGRCVASLFIDTSRPQARFPSNFAMRIYVDDPWATARGTPEEVEIICAMPTLAWLTLGMPIAFHKAMRGTRLQWIRRDTGYQYRRSVRRGRHSARKGR